MIKTNKKELLCIYDTAKSFYNKANIKRYYKKELVYKIELISYKNYYILELNYKNIINKEVIKKADIKALIKASVNN